MPLGDRGLLVRFGDRLSDAANIAAIDFALRAGAAGLPGVVEVVPNLVSVLLRYEPGVVSFDKLSGEVRLLGFADERKGATAHEFVVQVVFDGDDLAEVAGLAGLGPEAFVVAHNALPLRVLATGFAPGFVYCGMHGAALTVPRRATVRALVPAGTVLFAAGQTAITSTPIPTGWHVIGHTSFRNFDPVATPPASVEAGDTIRFEVA